MGGCCRRNGWRSSWRKQSRVCAVSLAVTSSENHAGVTVPDEPLAPKFIRLTGGNFRLLTRLLTQIERVLDVNELQSASIEVVEAALILP
jgi:hypothetical protein